MTAPAHSAGRILFLSQWFPFPADNGSKLRVRSLLSGLAKKHEVILISFDDKAKVHRDVSEARSICNETYVVPFKPYNPDSLKARLGYLSLTPRSVRDTYSSQMARCVREVVGTRKPDLIIASELGTAVYHPYFGAKPALFEEVEIGLLYERYTDAGSRWDAARHGLTWLKHKQLLAHTLRRFQKCTVVSEQERSLLLGIAPRGLAIEVIPNCIDLSDYRTIQGQSQQETLIFTGSFGYEPNYEAMLWFLDKVYPQIKARRPATRLVITGDHLNRPLPTAADVLCTGFVEDVRPLITGAAISIVPMQSGGGTRLKLLEAMALRTAVVSTNKGAEGLRLTHGAQILIADSPDEFSRCVVRLLQEPETRQQLASNAFQLVQNMYDWSIVMPRFVELVDTLIASSNSTRRRPLLA